MTPDVDLTLIIYLIFALSLIFLLLHIPHIDWVSCTATLRYYEFVETGDITVHKPYVYIDGPNFQIPYESATLYTALGKYSCIHLTCKVERRLKGFKIVRNILFVVPTSFVEENKEVNVI